MSLRRGFKVRANRISVRLRQSLELSPESPVDLKPILQRLNVPLVPLVTFAEEFPQEFAQLTKIDPGAFSAATLWVGSTRRIIIYNEFHSKGRQHANIAHELAHLLLGHTATLPIDPSGSRIVDRDIEDEATWLGSVILISDEAALYIVKSAMDSVTACREYGVSAPLLQMRINASGAHIRIKRQYH